MKREYTVLYQPIEDGWIMATVPELTGAVTHGKNIAEARSMIKEAVELLLLDFRCFSINAAGVISISFEYTGPD